MDTYVQGEQVLPIPGIEQPNHPAQPSGQGIGQRIIRTMIQWGGIPGYDTLYVREIYDYNAASRECFKGAGFEAHEKTEKGSGYR